MLLFSDLFLLERKREKREREREKELKSESEGVSEKVQSLFQHKRKHHGEKKVSNEESVFVVFSWIMGWGCLDL